MMQSEEINLAKCIAAGVSFKRSREGYTLHWGDKIMIDLKLSYGARKSIPIQCGSINHAATLALAGLHNEERQKEWWRDEKMVARNVLELPADQCVREDAEGREASRSQVTAPG